MITIHTGMFILKQRTALETPCVVHRNIPVA